MLSRPVFLLFLLCFGHFAVDFMWGVWPFFKTMRGIDLAWAGAIGGIGAFIAEISQVFFGAASDRGYRYFMIATGIVMAMIMPWISLGSTIVSYGLIYLTFAIGSAAFHPSAAGGLAHLFPKSTSLVFGLFFASGGLGLAISQVTFSSVYAAFDGWTVPLSSLGIPVILLAILIQVLGRAKKYEVEQKKNFAFLEIFQFFKRRETCLLWIFHLAIASVYWGMIFYLPDILKEKGCEEWICNGAGHMAFMLGAVFMGMPAGWLADKFSPRQVLLAIVFIGMFAFFSLLLITSLPAYYLLPLAALVGATLGVVTPLTISWGNSVVPESPGLISAFLMGFVWFAAELVGIAGVGFLSKFFEETPATQSLVVLGALFVVASFSLYRLGKREEIVPA